MPTAALPAIAPAAGPDPHPAWAAEAEALSERSRSMDESDEDLESLDRRACALEDLICATPARTLAGVREQLRLLARWQPPEDGEYALTGTALRNAAATVERLAGRA